VRETLTPVQIVELLGEVGAYGVNFHDNDLVPIDATASERDSIVREFKAACEGHGLRVPMATVSLFTEPFFVMEHSPQRPGGARLALQKTCAAMDLGKECGAEMFVLWGGREAVRRTPVATRLTR
jgi:xylose isomerase